MKRTELQRRTPLARGPSRLKRGPVGHASEAQRAKVVVEGCRLSAHTAPGEAIDPAHVTPRPHGGCDHPDCVIGLTRDLHRRYDNGELDILPYLTLDEQAHAVSHLGILGALKRTTGDNYVVEREAA